MPPACDGAPLRALDAVVFDLDDTLHDDTESYSLAAERVAEHLAENLRVDARVVHAAYITEANSFWETLSEKHLAHPLGLRQRLWHAALRRLGVDDVALAGRAASLFNAHRDELLQPFPGVIELLSSLRARERKLGMITNGFAETHRGKIASLELADAFDELFFADEVGMVKPDPRIFLRMCERLGVEPQRAAMVGDRFDRDISGAQEAGLRTVWFNVRSEELPRGARMPDATVAGIEALTVVLLGEQA